MDSQPTEWPDFELPDGLELPQELQGAAPRDLPESVKHGRLAQQRRHVLWGCLTACAACNALAPLPFVKTLSLYILPLGYLVWLGIGLAAIGILAYLAAPTLKQACRYIREGEVAFGRVLSLVKTPTLVVNDQTTTYGFVAQIQLLHPDTREVCVREVKSPGFATDVKDRIDTRFRIGDVVPVVWLPEQFDATAQIYDFLEVTPQASLVRDTKTGTPLWKTMALVAAIPAIFFTLFWNVYAFGRFHPLDFDFVRQGLWPFVVGGLLALVGIVIGYFIRAREKKRLATRNLRAIESGEAIELEVERNRLGRIFCELLLISGAILLGGGTLLCWCFTANALLDRSKAKLVSVQITEMTQTTHAFVLREYQLTYRLADDEEDKSLLTTPEHLMRFVAPVGVAHIHDGWLGWTWIETVDPVVIEGEIPNSLQPPENADKGATNGGHEEAT